MAITLNTSHPKKPYAVVSSVPTEKMSNIIYNTTDEHFYIWDDTYMTSLLGTTWQILPTAEKTSYGTQYSITYSVGPSTPFSPNTYTLFLAPLARYGGQLSSTDGYFWYDPNGSISSRIYCFLAMEGVSRARLGYMRYSYGFYTSYYSDIVDTVTFTGGTDINNQTLINWLRTSTNATYISGGGAYIKLVNYTTGE